MRQIIEARYTAHGETSAYAYHGRPAQRDAQSAAAWQFYCPDRRAEAAKREYDRQQVSKPFVYEPDGLPNFPE